LIVGPLSARWGEGLAVAASGTMNDVLSAFFAATQLRAPAIAGSLIAVCVAVGTVLVLGWLLHVGSDAVRGGDFARAPHVLLLVVAAFLVLVSVLGVFYS
jgi:hypothetical protein